jgi:hypothetical protein
MPKQCCKDTWDKIPEDEPVFVIRGKDVLGPTMILHWINSAKQLGVNQDKIERAYEHVNDMLNFQKENSSRVKIPD